MKESDFQKSVKDEIKDVLIGCVILKNDPTYIQGIPDLIILYGERWAALECKKEEDSPYRPNQEWWINKMNIMSFAAFIYPENRQEVLNELFDFMLA